MSEYKSEAFLYFEQMMGNIRSDICMNLFRSATNLKAFDNMLATLSRTARRYGPESVDGSSFIQTSRTDNRQSGEVELPKVTVRREGPKLGRNDPCSCGSGRKYKKCCGRRV